MSNPRIKTAVILAGGKGTRLKPFTMTIPKPLLPVGDIPILEVVLRQLAAAGIWRVVVTLGHMGHLLMASIGDGARFGLDIEYYNEDKPRGTAGSLRLVKNLDENFLVMNGDLLTTLDYKKLFEAHIKRNSSATIAVHKREVKIDYGVMSAWESIFCHGIVWNLFRSSRSSICRSSYWRCTKKKGM